MTDSPRSIADVIRFSTAPRGPFASMWEAYRRVGIVAYPKDPDGKKPAVKAGRRQPGDATLREWAAGRFCSAGIILRTGRISDLTVIDVDAHGNRARVPELVREVEAHCGPTPVKVLTPSGGVHLWYRHDRERNRAPQGDARDRLPVDVRGEGGWTVAPPTMTEKGEYRFLAGELADVLNLPKINPGGLPALYGDIIPAKAAGTGKLREGDGRNNALYRILCEAALNADSEEMFHREADRLNAAMCADLLPAAELKKTLAGIWQRKLGKGAPLYRSVAEPYAIFTLTDWQRFGFDPYNIAITVMARLIHGPRRFALSSRAMKRSPFFKEWARDRIDRSTAFLAGPGGAFRQVKKGGRGPGDAAQYELLPTLSAALPEQRGDDGLVPARRTNITNHPPPPSLTEATRTTRGPAREQARREGEPGRLSAASSFPSGLRAAPSAPGGSDPGTSVPAVMISSTRNHPSESVGAKISAADRPGDQLDLVEYLGGEARPAPLDPQEVRQWMLDLGLSQRSAAMLAGFSHYGSLSAWLAGRQGLSPENAARLRQAMTINSNVA